MQLRQAVCLGSSWLLFSSPATCWSDLQACRWQSRMGKGFLN